MEQSIKPPSLDNLQDLELIPVTGNQSVSSNEFAAVLTNLNNNSLPAPIIIIDGPNGYGKTTLLKKSVRDLHSESIASVYVDLGGYAFHGGPEALKECVDGHKEAIQSKRLMYFFDGFDEFMSKMSWNMSEFFTIASERNRCNLVVVGTRPCGVNYWVQKCKIKEHYTIGGFTPKALSTFLEVHASPELKRLIKTHKTLYELCKIPLICTEVLNVVRSKKFCTYSALSVTDIVHEVILQIVKREIMKTRNEHVRATNLHSLGAEHFQIISTLAFLDLVHASNLDSLSSFSYFLSSFFLKYGISSLKEVEDLGLVYHCEQNSYYANLKRRLYWFLCPEVRDFLAAFMLHLWAPLDQLYFFSEHAQQLLQRSDKDGYSGWLLFFYGLTVQRQAEYNPTRMVMSSLNELLAHCLSLDNSFQRTVYIECLSEAKEPSLWRKLAARNVKFFDMTLTADEVGRMESCLVDLIASSGFKEWTIEVSPYKKEVVDLVAKRVYGKTKVRVTFDASLGDKVKLCPSTRVQSKSACDSNLFLCRAIRELLQRVLQIYTPWKLKGDCSTASYVSFLSCECFKEAIEGHVFFEPVIATHFLTLESASKKAGKGESDPVMRHIREVHNDTAVELVILLHPSIRRLTFQLPISDSESTHIQLSGDYVYDADYARCIALYVEGLEEVVPCIVSHDSSSRTEFVFPCLPLSKEFKNNGTVAPEIFLPPSSKKNSLKAEAEKILKASSTYPVAEDSHYALQVESEGYPSTGVVSITSKTLFSDGRPTTQPIQQHQKMPQQSNRKLTNVKPGTVLFTSEPFHVPLDVVVPLFDQNPLIQVGGNGQIFEGTINGIKFAVKKTPYRSKEYAVITKVQHRNVIPLVAFIWGEENSAHKRRYFCYHVMPRMSGDLARMVTDKPDLTLKNLHLTHTCQLSVVTFNTQHILSSVLEALAYLHSIHIAHRDIKPSNILVKFPDCECDVPLLCSCQTKFDVRLCDFDAALQLDADDCMQPVTFSSSQTMLALAPQFHSVPVGTSGYRAPECSMHTTTNNPDSFSPPISCQCDIFSLGVLCVRLMVGDEGPHRQRVMALLLLHYHCEKGCVEGRWKQGRWKHEVPMVVVEDILKISKIRREMQWLNHVPDFVESCLKVDPLSRPSATQLLLHPFLMCTNTL